jgi:hypothetical protein
MHEIPLQFVKTIVQAKALSFVFKSAFDKILNEGRSFHFVCIEVFILLIIIKEAGWFGA